MLEQHKEVIPLPLRSLSILLWTTQLFVTIPAARRVPISHAVHQHLYLYAAQEVTPARATYFVHHKQDPRLWTGIGVHVPTRAGNLKAVPISANQVRHASAPPAKGFWLIKVVHSESRRWCSCHIVWK